MISLERGVIRDGEFPAAAAAAAAARNPDVPAFDVEQPCPV